MESVYEKVKKLTRWRKKRFSVDITDVDPVFKVVYLGNVLTGWAKGEGCLEKPLATLWKNYCNNKKANVVMRLAVCSSGLQATTSEHGLTEYWSHRVTWYAAPPSYPRIFAWIYRHEGRKSRQELRCHAVLCSTSRQAEQLSSRLGQRLREALHNFRQEKLSRQSARLSLSSCLYNGYWESIPKRKLLLAPGVDNYRPPVERSRSAPKLGSIEESPELEDIEEQDWLRVLALRYQSRPSSLEIVVSAEDCSRESEESESLPVSDHIAEDFSDSSTESEDSLQEFRMRIEVDSASSGMLENDSLDEETSCSFLCEKLRLMTDLNVCEDTDNVSDESGYSEEKENSTCSSSDEENFIVIKSSVSNTLNMNKEFTLNL